LVSETFLKDLANRALDLAESTGGRCAEVRIAQEALPIVSVSNGILDATGDEQRRAVERFFAARELPALRRIRFSPTGSSAPAT
jgi:hypothetical protein